MPSEATDHANEAGHPNVLWGRTIDQPRISRKRRRLTLFGKQLITALKAKPSLNAFERVALLVLPSLATLGPTLPFLGPFFAFRAVALLFLLVALVRKPGKGPRHSLVFLAVSFCISMLAIGLLDALVFGPDEATWKEYLSVTAGSAFLIGVLILRDRLGALRFLLHGWLIAFYVSALIAIREIFWGMRWENYYQDDVLSQNWGSASSFANPNNFATFLVASIGALLLGALWSKTPIVRLAYIAALAITPFLMLETQSRTGVLLLGLILAMFTIGYRPVRRAIIGLILILVAFVIIRSMDGRSIGLPNDELSSQIYGQYSVNFLGIDIGMDASTFVRWNLIGNGIVFFARSPLVGNGAGSFEVLSATSGDLNATLGILSPHNGFLEILSQYGIIAATLFVAIWLVILRVALRASIASKSYQRERATALVLLSAAVTLPFTLVMNSSYLDPSTMWLILCFHVLLGIVLQASLATRRESIVQET